MRIITTLILTLVLSTGFAQRTYKSNSVLANGNWYKIAVKNNGIYKIDVAFLQSLGISTSNLSSSTIRLFGNGGGMLPEANNVNRIDDLAENAIFVVDGGDGIFSGSDYFLFYAPGPDAWIKDSINQRFRHQKNLYSDKSFYYITIGGTGLRIQNKNVSATPNVIVSTFRDRYFYELDSINFLQSGKQWFGEEFASAPGKTLTRNFSVNMPNLVTGTPAIIGSSVLGRSTGGGNNFRIQVNGTDVMTQGLLPTGTGTYDPVATTNESYQGFTPTQTTLSVQYLFQPGSVNAQGWLNWFELFAQRQLNLNGADQLLFRDWESVAPSNVAEFRIQNANTAAQVWDVTDPLNPVNMQGSLTGSEFRFRNTTERLREYAAFGGQAFLRPEALGPVANQNLHNSSVVSYIIIANPAFLSQAQRLGAWHQQNNNLSTVVVTTEQVYNEFSSGIPDPAAIRDFVKMYYDKAGGTVANRPLYLLLFGDASYDFKNRVSVNTNFVPCFESESSLDPLSTYVSDDFFGFLDDIDNVNTLFPAPLLDIGIGRIPARSLKEATNVVDKIIRYHDKESFGPWRNEITLVADDEDNNLHFDDAEFHASVLQSKPTFHLNKIYLDGYRQQSGSGGSRYPEVNQAINSRIYSGTLIWNYSGHGGFRRLAEEVILDQEMVNTWTNTNKLPLFVTATCDFAPYDNPAINSIGEDILLREKSGAVAMMTTTRVVFAFSNRIINNNYFQTAFVPDANGVYPSLGESIKRTKNVTYQTFGDVINNRKFALLGDPAMTLAFPKLKVKTTLINNRIPGADTISALERYTISGVVTDVNGNTLSDFNGHVYPVIYDKSQQLKTLANDPESLVEDFTTQQNIVFKGKAKVTNGQFSYTFVVPKDINYQFGNGKISYYAENGIVDGAGAEASVIVGGASANPITDQRGPEIKAYLNDEKFVNGGITNQTPVLVIRLFDSSGINTVGTGIGHDITATLDGDNNTYYVLNDFYEADADSYQRGTVRFQLPKLEEGLHTLKIKAWDVMNNSSDYVLEFRVVKDQELKLERVYNYPNPFTTKTRFMFEHNRPGDNLQVTLRIFTVAGKVVKTMSHTIINDGNRSFEIEWDGKDDYGNKVGRGVYIYQVTVKDSNGKKQSALQKLVVL